MLEASGLTRVFGKSVRPALAEINLKFEPGDAVAIVGESGSGKTTLARLLLGLDRPTAGSVQFLGRPLAMGGRAWRSQRTALQMIPQHAAGSLDPRMTIRRHFLEVLQEHRKNVRGSFEQIMVARMQEVRLKPEHLDAYPRNLSGGQQQRAVIARSLLLEPRVLICDEPTSALDPLTQVGVSELLRTRCISPDRVFVVITHDLRVAWTLSNRVLVMRAGEVVEQGATEHVLENPSDPYTQELLDAVTARRGPQS